MKQGIFTGPSVLSGLEKYLINSNSMNLKVHLTNYNLDDNSDCSSLTFLHFDQKFCLNMFKRKAKIK